jgi:predicted phage terminase large subunit-like protein
MALLRELLSEPAPAHGKPRRPPSLTAYEREVARRRAEDDRRRVARDADAIRERCKSLIGFVREFWSILEPGRDFVCGWAIEAIALHLEAVTRGDIQYLLINVPPGMMKSLLVSVFWPAWEWGPMGLNTLGFLTSSFGLDNVTRDNNKMRRLVESDKYQALYGDLVSPGNKWGERLFQNAATGVRAGRSFEKMTGGRGDRVTIDDPHDVNGAESQTQRESTVDTFRTAIPDRLNDMRKSAIVVIMQRLHANDVSGTILKLKLPYCHLNLPMEFESYRTEGERKVDARCRTYDRNGNLLFEDPREHDGDLLFPERFPRDVVEGLKQSKGSYAYAGQYQQRPTAREGGMFKRAWFAGKIIDRATMPRNIARRCRAWDLAGTEESAASADPDWTAGLRLARDGADYYVENVQRDRLSPGGVQALIRSVAETDPIGTIVRMPQDPAQAGKAQAHNYVVAMAGFSLKIETTAGRGDKEGRATPASIQAEFGHVWIVNSGPPELGLDPWIEPFLDELCSFPKGAHDDQVDAFSDALNELALGGTGNLDSMSAGERETIAAVERDSRYRFGDNAGQDGGSGFGSVRSNSLNGASW